MSQASLSGRFRRRGAGLSLAVVLAVLTAVGVTGVSQAGVLVGPGRAGQAAVTSPPPTGGAPMVYDAATGTVVLFRSSAYPQSQTWSGPM